MSDVQVLGPRVRVEREGTADAGGGQIVLSDGKLLVRARSIERELGAVAAVQRAEILDLARQRAVLHFVDGSRWHVEAEAGDEIYPFLQEVERIVGSPGWVRPPPRLSERVREAATPERKRWALLTLVALLLLWPLRLLGALATPVGYVLAVLGLLLLAAVVVALSVRQGGPPWLQHVRDSLALLGPVPALVFAAVLVLAGGLGAADATARARREARQARELAQAQADAQAEAERLAAERAQRQRQAGRLAERMRAALEAGEVRAAQRLRGELQATTAGHPALGEIAAELDAAIARLDERERARGVVTALRAARRMRTDPISCEAINAVAETWRQLSAIRPSDPQYDAAPRAVATLEKCRGRVTRALSRDADAARKQQRASTPTQVQARLRKLGIPARVQTEGRRGDRLLVLAPGLDDAAVARVTAQTDGDGKGFLDARAAEGFRAVIFRADGYEKRFDLEPTPARELIEPVLQQAGLGVPLRLPATPDAATPDAASPQ